MFVLSDSDIDVQDFCDLVMYFMTNTDLEDQDVRLNL